MGDLNENRRGYKETKVGWIPEEWECFPGNRLTTVIAKGSSPHWQGYEYTPSGMLFITSENVKDGYLELGSPKYLPLDFHKKLKRTQIKKGDILINLVGSIGRSCLVVNNLDSANVNQAVCVFRVKDGFCREYVAYYFQAPNTVKSLLRMQVVSAQPNISLTDLRNFLIPLPPLPEQKKIAGILSNWDEAIEQTRKLIEAKRRHKKALMQQVLTGKRLYRSYDHDNWCIKTLADLIEPVIRPVPKPQNPYLSIGIRSHGKGTFQKIVEQPEKVMMDTLYRIEANDLVVNITFAWEGAIAIASEQDSGGLVSHRFPTYRLRETEANIDFFRNLILTKRFVWDLGLISPGGAGRNRVLSQKDFLKLRVVVPSLELQREIGRVLTAVDTELHLWEDYLKALEKQKRGLMQKLLTGQVQVTNLDKSCKRKDLGR